MLGINELRNIPILNEASFLKSGPATTIQSLSPEQAKIFFLALCQREPTLRDIWPDLAMADQTPMPDSDEAFYAREGDQRFIRHLRRERSPELVTRKRSAVLEKYGRLDCEVCCFNFNEFYGARGIEFCEVHHVNPLSKEDTFVETRLKDLAVVCSNCHRMLHRDPLITVESLRRKLLKRLPRSNNEA